MEKMIEAINNKQCLIDYINRYGDFGNSVSGEGLCKANFDYVFRHWVNNKSWLYDCFGGKLTVSRKIEVEEPRQVLVDNVWRELWDNASPMGSFRAAMDRTIAQLDSYDSGMENTTSLYWVWEYCKSIDNLVDNRFNNNVSMFLNNKIIRLSEDMKTTKVIKMFAEHFNLMAEYENFRIQHSQLLNTKKLTGELCLSIHPLDYFTASDNNSGWESCMSWRDNGCYHGGTIEMMNSPSVVVAYLKAKDDMDILGYNWNNKKWRCFMIMDKHGMITTIKGYPYYDNANLLDACRDFAIDILGWKSDSYFTYTMSSDDYCDHNYINGDKFIDFETNIMYNDFGCGQPLHMAFTNEYFESIPDYDYYNYSGEYICMGCGDFLEELIEDDRDEARTMCEACSGRIPQRCEHCGMRVHRDYGQCDENGNFYCDDCYNDLYTHDTLYGEELLREEANNVYTFRSPGHFKAFKDAAESLYTVREIDFMDNLNWQVCTCAMPKDIEAFYGGSAEDVIANNHRFKCLPHVYTIEKFNKTIYYWICSEDCKSVREMTRFFWDLDAGIEDNYANSRLYDRLTRSI